MSKTKVILSGVAWTIIQNVVSILYGIVSVPFLISYFGKEEYGLIGLALSVNVYIQLLDMGMTNSNVRFFSEYLAKKDSLKVQSLFSLTHLFYLIIGVINSIVLFVVSLYVENLFKVTPEQAVTLRHLLWVLVINATFSWVSTCFDQFLRANELIDWIKKRTTLLKILQFVILFATIQFNLSIELYFAGYIFIITAILPLTILKSKRVFPELKLSLSFDKEMFRTVFPYAMSLFSFGIFQFLAFNFRPLILGNMNGPGAVADFNVMSTIAMVVTVISGSFLQVLLPIVTKMSVNNESEAVKRTITVGTKYVAILLTFVIFFLVLLNREILDLYVGKEFEHLSPWLVLWLLTLLCSHRNVMTSLVYTEKNLKSVSVMGFVAMAVAFIAYFLLVPKYGVGGVVIGFTLHELTHTLFYYIIFVPQRFHYPTGKMFLKSVLPSWIVLGSLIGVITIAIPPIDKTIVSVIVKGAIYFVVAAGLIWLVILNASDRVFLKEIAGLRRK